VRLHELLDMAENAPEEQRKMVAVFHEALNNFENRRWQTAVEGFKEALSLIPEDPPSKLFLERCEQYIKTPPEDAWDGVYNLTSK